MISNPVYDIYFEGDDDPPSVCFFREKALSVFLQGILLSNTYPEATMFAVVIDTNESGSSWYSAENYGHYRKKAGKIEIVSERGIAIGLLQRIGF